MSRAEVGIQAWLQGGYVENRSPRGLNPLLSLIIAVTCGGAKYLIICRFVCVGIFVVEIDVQP